MYYSLASIEKKNMWLSGDGKSWVKHVATHLKKKTVLLKWLFWRFIIEYAIAQWYELYQIKKEILY
jgi:hypothetical protein